MKKRLDVLTETSRRFNENVRTFYLKRPDVFFGSDGSLAKRYSTSVKSSCFFTRFAFATLILMGSPRLNFRWRRLPMRQ